MNIFLTTYYITYYKLLNCAFGNSIIKFYNLQYDMVGLADYHLNVHFIKRTFESTVLESFHGMKENAYVGYIRCDALEIS